MARPRVALLVAFPVAGCLAAWLLFGRLLLPSAPRVLDAAVVATRSGDGLAVVTERIAISATRPADCVVTWPSRQLVVDEKAAATGAGGGALTVATTVGTSLQGVHLPRFGFRLLVVTDVVPFRVTARVSGDPRDAALAVSNGGDRALRDCFLWVNGKGYTLGDVDAGETVTRRVTKPDTSGALIDDARRAALWDVESAGLEGTRPMLVGWIEGPALPSVIEGAVPTPGRPALTLVLVEAQ